MKRKLFVFLSILISLTACGETVVYSRKHSSSKTETAYVVPSESGQTASSSVKSTNVYSTTTGISEISTSSSGYSSSEDGNYINTDAKVFKVFDKGIDQDIQSNYRIYLREYDDPTFYAYRLGYLRQGNNTFTIRDYGDIWALYVFDIDDDGYRDFAWVYKDSTTMLYTIYAHGMSPYKSLFLRNCERGDYSYFLETDDENLYVKETASEYNDTTTGYGKIIARDNHGYVEWLNTHGVVDFGFRVMIANKERTPVSTWKDDEGTKFFGSSCCFYLVDIIPLAEKDVSNINLPISISGTMSILSKPARVDGFYRYTVRFANNIGNFYLDFTIFNITKRLALGGPDDSIRFISFSDYFDWAKEANSDDIHLIKDVDYTTVKTLGFRSIGTYSDKNSINRYITWLDYPANEIDPNDYSIDYTDYHSYDISYWADWENEIAPRYTFYLYSGRFVCYEGRWFLSWLKTDFGLDPLNADSYYYGFDDKNNQINVLRIDDNVCVQTLGISNLYFKTSRDEIIKVDQLKYYFIVGGKKFLVVNQYMFCNEWGTITFICQSYSQFTYY